MAVTVADRPAGDLTVRSAMLLLIERNTGDAPDVVEPIRSERGMWFGPAVFDAFVEIEGEEVVAP